MHTHSLPRAAGVALVASTLLAACGTGGFKDPRATDADKAVWMKTVTLAAERTIQAETARTAVELREGAENTSAKGEGLYDARAGRVQLSVVDDGGVKGGIVFDRSIVYVEVPPDQRAAVPGGKPWLKVDVAMLTGVSDEGLRSLAQIGNVDPAQGLTLIKGMTRDVERIGTDTLRGAPTTHYRGTVDRRALLERPATQLEPHVREALQHIESDEFPTDVWVDRDGRLRKLRYEVAVRGRDGKGRAKRTGSIEFFDFGTTARIAPPDEGQVFDFSRMLGRLRAATGGGQT
jgi:hypothetical protein